MQKQQKKNPLGFTSETLRIFWAHSKRYPWRVTIITVVVLIYELLQIYEPLLYRDLINLLTSLGKGADFQPAIAILIVILAVKVVRSFAWRAGLFVNNYFMPKVMNDLMNTCYQYLNKHSYSFFTSKFVGSLVTKVKRYERSYETIATQIIFDLGRSLLDTAVVFAVLIWQYGQFSYPIIIWCGLFLVFSYFYSRFKLPYDLKRSEADTQTTAQLADSITNNVNIKLFTSSEAENRRFGKVTEEQFRLRKRSYDLGTWGDMIQNLSMIALEFFIMYRAIVLWSEGAMQVGDIVLLQIYLGRIFEKLWDTGKNIRAVYEALADANEMTAILRQPHEIKDALGAGKLAVQQAGIEFRKVSFGYYKDLPVLQNFDLLIKPGERVAFIGPSGGGKTTILKLLFRFHDIQGGEILVDGKNIAQVTQDSLRVAMAFVPQDPILFHRSLFENIRYASPKASEKEVIRAAKLAHAHEFITSFPQSYDTLVGERGIKLSGGERQRVAIARAILKDAPILVLDEATSSLDSESEMFIQDALHTLMQGRTNIVVAHRLSTIMQMDRIIVVEKGKIIEEGSHEDLLKVHKGTYQKLWGIQAGGFSPA